MVSVQSRYKIIQQGGQKMRDLPFIGDISWKNARLSHFQVMGTAPPANTPAVMFFKIISEHISKYRR